MLKVHLIAKKLLLWPAFARKIRHFVKKSSFGGPRNYVREGYFLRDLRTCEYQAWGFISILPSYVEKYEGATYPIVTTSL